jgi:hypothetical protein
LSYTMYSMPRYAVQAMPIAYVVAAAGLIAWLRLAWSQSARIRSSCGDATHRSPSSS